MSASAWFEVHEFPDDIIGLREPWHTVDVWSYLVRGRDLALLFDTGNGFANIRTVTDQFTHTPVLVVNSHAHWDHIGDNWRFDRVWVHASEAEQVEMGVANARFRHWLRPEHFQRALPGAFDPDTYAIPGTPVERRLNGGERIDLGDRVLEVIHTPGHSPGGIALYEARTGALLSADAVYAGDLLVQFPDSAPDVYRQTLARLAELAPSVSAVYPGHYAAPLDPSILLGAHEGAERVWTGEVLPEYVDGLTRYACGAVSFVFQDAWRSGPP